MKFSDDEKKIMVLLQKWDSHNNFVSNILCDDKGVLPPPLNSPINLSICFTKVNDASFYISEERVQGMNLNYLWVIVRQKVVILLNLLNYLEREKYIRNVQNPGAGGFSSIPIGYIAFQPLDADISKELYDLRYATFIVLPKLEELISNDFKTEEDRKLEQEDKRAVSTLNVARAALIVSIVSVVVSVASIIASFQPIQVVFKWLFFRF